MNTDKAEYKEAFKGKDNESLDIFLRNIRKFDARFCDAMTSGVDFTLKLEIHGNKGELLHVKVDANEYERPSGVEKRVEEKKGRRFPRLNSG